VNDWLAIDVVDEAYQAFLEFVSGVDEDVAHTERACGPEASESNVPRLILPIPGMDLRIAASRR
jgi:hypothetical protein